MGGSPPSPPPPPPPPVPAVPEIDEEALARQRRELERRRRGRSSLVIDPATATAGQNQTGLRIN